MLLEHAGEALPALAAAAGGDTFAPFFAGFLPLLLCKTVSASFLWLFELCLPLCPIPKLTYTTPLIPPHLPIRSRIAL